MKHDGYDYRLQPGMVLVPKPCPIRHQGDFGMMLSRTLAVTEEGAEAITQTPLELAVSRSGGTVRPRPGRGGDDE